MHVLDRLVENNEYPIIFIGSGISKRYIDGFPTWEDLLEEYWEVIEEETPFYSHLITLSKELKEQHPDYSDDRIDFLVNTKVAKHIEEKFEEKFLDAKVEVPGLDYKSYYQSGLSAFKESIAIRFRNYKLKGNVEDEVSVFKELLKKARIIVTTNYDNFIEDVAKDDNGASLDTYLGSEGFFNESQGWAELFKIHGGIDQPNSIVITEEDYKTYDENKILISAKLIAALVNSPIIFLGYSLKDENVQSLISDFASQLPREDSRISAQRIIVVEREEHQDKIIEQQVREYHHGWNYTLLKTDNFQLLFESLIKINQGLSPYHVRKYNQVIKKLVISKGKEGALESVLLSPDELGKIEDKINAGKPIVVALGDKATIFMMPNLNSYLEDYVLEKNEIMPEVALSFVAAMNQPKSRIPFVKYIKDVNIEDLDLSSKDLSKIKNRIIDHGSIDKCIKSINKYNQINAESINEITSTEYSKSKEVDVVTFNILKLDEAELTTYVKDLVVDILPTASGPLLSHIRKLLTAYDLKIHGDIK